MKELGRLVQDVGKELTWQNIKKKMERSDTIVANANFVYGDN